MTSNYKGMELVKIAYMLLYTRHINRVKSAQKVYLCFTPLAGH